MILGGIWSRRTAAIFVISGLKFLLHSVKYWKCPLGYTSAAGRRRYEIRECTSEKEKSKSPRGESPLRD